MTNGLPLRLLVVDDNKTLAWALRKALVEYGYLCGVAHTHALALEAIESNTFHAVIADFHLKPGSGLEVLRGVRRLSPTTIRVLISGSMQPGDWVEASLVHAHFAKPVVAHDVHNVIERSRRPKPLA